MNLKLIFKKFDNSFDIFQNFQKYFKKKADFFFTEPNRH